MIGTLRRHQLQYNTFVRSLTRKKATQRDAHMRTGNRRHAMQTAARGEQEHVARLHLESGRVEALLTLQPA